MLQRAFGLLCVELLFLGCAPQAAGPEEEVASTAQELRANRRIQAGSDLILLAVTEDGHALYQEGQTVYATRLKPNAQRTRVADVPGTNLAFPLQVGEVVFVWTDPQRQLPGFGVSPLVLWTSAGGPRVISTASAVGLVATAASPDNSQLLFTTNATPDGLRGDLAFAHTCTATSPTLLLQNIPLDFPNGLCRPLAGFAGTGSSAFPVATYCAGTDTTATLSKWVGGTKTDLVANIATPLLFTLETNPQGTRFLVNLANGTLVTVTAAGQVTPVDSVPRTRGFLTRDGTAVYGAPGPGGVGRELRLARSGQAPQTVGPVAALYSELYNRGGYFRSRSASPDSKKALFGSMADPATGLTDLKLLDIPTGAVTTLEVAANATTGNEIFTADSDYALYFVIDVNTGLGPLFAGGKNGKRQISSTALAADVLRGTGSIVSYTENPFFDPRREFLLSTADLMVADVDKPNKAPRLISAQAGFFYLPSADREDVIFTSMTESAGPGLYVARAR
jgi:hypothetical protein